MTTAIATSTESSSVSSSVISKGAPSIVRNRRTNKKTKENNIPVSPVISKAENELNQFLAQGVPMYSALTEKHISRIWALASACMAGQVMTENSVKTAVAVFKIDLHDGEHKQAQVEKLTSYLNKAGLWPCNKNGKLVSVISFYGEKSAWEKKGATYVKEGAKSIETVQECFVRLANAIYKTFYKKTPQSKDKKSLKFDSDLVKELHDFVAKLDAKNSDLASELSAILAKGKEVA